MPPPPLCPRQSAGSAQVIARPFPPESRPSTAAFWNSWQPDINDGVRLNIRPFLAATLSRGKKGAGVLRGKPNVKWEKDRGKEPSRLKEDFPWFWKWDDQAADFPGDREFDGNRWNECHYTTAFKRAARERKK